MPSTKDIILGRRFMGMFIGPNGFGKTGAAASFHKAGPMKFYDFDGRMSTVKLLYPDADITYVTYGPENFITFQEDYQLDCKMNKYATLVIDSFTSLSMTTITFQMRLKGVDKGKILRSGLAVTTWDEINGETMLISMLIDTLKMFRGNVIFTAHPINKTEITSGGSNKVRTIAAYGNKIPQIAPGYFDEIYTFDIHSSGNPDVPPKRVIYTIPVMGDFGKSSLGLPQKVEFDSFGKTDLPLYDKLTKILSERGIKLGGSFG